ncbi:helix-turn-helix domain-containing protein [Actinocorallia aurea]
MYVSVVAVAVAVGDRTAVPGHDGVSAIGWVLAQRAAYEAGLIEEPPFTEMEGRAIDRAEREEEASEIRLRALSLVLINGLDVEVAARRLDVTSRSIWRWLDAVKTPRSVSAVSNPDVVERTRFVRGVLEEHQRRGAEGARAVAARLGLPHRSGKISPSCL